MNDTTEAYDLLIQGIVTYGSVRGMAYSSRQATQEAHLSTNGAGTDTPVLASVTCAIGVDIPPDLFVILAIFCNVGVKGLLGSSANVPAESAADTVEPFGVGAGDGRERVLRGSDGDTISLSELETALAVESTVGSGSTITTKSQDKVKLFRLAPAQIGCPVLEHVLEARVLGKQTRCIEASRITELSINIDINAEVGAVAWGSQEPASKLTGEIDQLIVACLCDNHDVANSALDGTALKLLGDFAHTSCGRNETRMRHGNIVLDLFEDLADVDSVSEALVIEAWRLKS
ncbi:hypothetical protein HG531_001565 [Fusarium graminearum]|nr:hypothetical protein HG531_001565 [Fusarium graminearum]